MNEYPIFRRSASGRSYYHIVSPNEMIELQILGKYFMRYNIVARIMPERVLIDDIIKLRDGAYEAIMESDYRNMEKDCVENRIPANQP